MELSSLIKSQSKYRNPAKIYFSVLDCIAPLRGSELGFRWASGVERILIDKRALMPSKPSSELIQCLPHRFAHLVLLKIRGGVVLYRQWQRPESYSERFFTCFELLAYGNNREKRFARFCKGSP
jgi:hypothetical protein